MIDSYPVVLISYESFACGYIQKLENGAKIYETALAYQWKFAGKFHSIYQKAEDEKSNFIPILFILNSATHPERINCLSVIFHPYCQEFFLPLSAVYVCLHILQGPWNLQKTVSETEEWPTDSSKSSTGEWATYSIQWISNESKKKGRIVV